mgnify:CR=1 FL=1|tara:strand:- start:1032 stop:1175 length:144 start_codon:yes stop_codon:yes gene_type:complete
MDQGKCVPIKTYEEWNKCITTCDTILKPKTKSYEPKEWVRPRPYAYP